MTTLENEGDWNILEGTDDDLQFIEDQQEELLSCLPKGTGVTRKAVETAIKEYRAALIS